MRKFFALILSLTFVLILVGCEGMYGKDFDKTDDLHEFYATILEIHDDYFLVEPGEGTEELKFANKFTVPTQNAYSTVEWQVGDLVMIKYDGVILESYPAQLGQVDKIGRASCRERV